MHTVKLRLWAVVLGLWACCFKNAHSKVEIVGSCIEIMGSCFKIAHSRVEIVGSCIGNMGSCFKKYMHTVELRLWAVVLGL